MSKDNYVQPPKEPSLKKIIEAMKDGYSYLHPDYWKRKLVHLILVVPMVLIIYGLIYESIFVDLIGMDSDTMPWILEFIDLFLIIGSTVVSAYFYPFSLWWYKQSLIGKILNNIYHIGTFWVVILKIIGTLIGGIAIAGTLAPIMGPLTLRKCRKKNMVIGDADDFY